MLNISTRLDRTTTPFGLDVPEIERISAPEQQPLRSTPRHQHAKSPATVP